MSAWPFMIIRLWPDHHNDPAALAELLRLLKRHRRACDEVWFCTEFGFPSLDAHRASAKRMAWAAERVRRAGFLPGVQIANTIGHADTQAGRVAGAWQGLVGHDGKVARTCNCPRAPDFLEYVRESTRAYAAWQPSSVWMDDDLRLTGHAPVEFGCFCRACLNAFSAAQGRRWRREPLVRAFNRLDNGALRSAWVRFNQESLAIVARAVGQAVTEVAPDCRLGCQHVWSSYSGLDYAPVFKALAVCSPQAVGSRPGGGYYTDHRPREMLGKALVMAREVSRLPKRVRVICPEIENYPHLAFGKSAHGTAIESAWDLAQVGANSLSYAILCSRSEPPAVYGSLLARLAAWRPFLERYVSDNEGACGGGVDPVRGRRHMARPLQAGEPPMIWGYGHCGDVNSLVALGLPLCPDSAGACASLLTAEAARGLTDPELRTLLKRGVLTDGQTAWELQERGWGSVTRVRASRLEVDAGLIERSTAEPLNGPYAGQAWRPGGGLAFTLQTEAPGARVVSELVRAEGGAVLGPGTVVTGTSLGGRLAVLGAGGWDPVMSSGRRAQMLALADWVSRGRLPALLDTPAQVALAARVDRDGALRSVMLLNMSIDRSPRLCVRVRGRSRGRALWIRPGKADGALRACGVGQESVFMVPAMAPWSLGYLLVNSRVKEPAKTKERRPLTAPGRIG